MPRVNPVYTMTTSILHGASELTVEVKYQIFGKHYPATRWQPEEFPDVQVASVAIPGQEWISFDLDKMDEDALIELHGKCIEHWTDHHSPSALMAAEEDYCRTEE